MMRVILLGIAVVMVLFGTAKAQSLTDLGLIVGRPYPDTPLPLLEDKTRQSVKSVSQGQKSLVFHFASW